MEDEINLENVNKKIDNVDSKLENVKFAHEILKDYKEDVRKLTIICLSLIVAIAAIVAIFCFVYDKQQNKFLDFLNQYDFETVSQDGEGYNYYNRDIEIGGDLNNGAENTTTDTQGQESERVND